MLASVTASTSMPALDAREDFARARRAPSERFGSPDLDADPLQRAIYGTGHGITDRPRRNSGTPGTLFGWAGNGER